MLILRAKINTKQDFFNLIKDNAPVIREKRLSSICVSRGNVELMDHLSETGTVWFNFFSAFDRTCHERVGWTMSLSNHYFFDSEEPLVIFHSGDLNTISEQVREALFRQDFEEALK